MEKTVSPSVWTLNRAMPVQFVNNRWKQPRLRGRTMMNAPRSNPPASGADSQSATACTVRWARILQRV